MNDVYAEARERLDLRDVAAHYGVELRGSFGRCPFHDDRHPSLSVHKDYFRCFGGSCGARGDVIEFTAKLYGLQPYDALCKLNDDFALHLPLHTRRRKGSKPVNTETKEIVQGFIDWVETMRYAVLDAMQESEARPDDLYNRLSYIYDKLAFGSADTLFNAYREREIIARLIEEAKTGELR